MINDADDLDDAQPSIAGSATTSADTGESSLTAHMTEAQRPRNASAARLPTRRHLIMIFGTACVWLVMMTFLLANADPTVNGHAQPAPTPTQAPTATATQTPSPTPMTGFELYVDRLDGFTIQYPQTWVFSSTNPGAQFDDNSVDNSYEVQVLLPGQATTPDTSPGQDPASAWVNYEMSQLAKLPGSFQQIAGPVPSRTIGGQTWESGVALISSNQTIIRVQVYATVYQGKPFLINLLAVDDRFTAGTVEFFNPMLDSFKFLPSNS